MKKLSFVLMCMLLLLSTVHAQQFRVSYPSSVFNGPFTGHVILYLSKTAQEPRKEIYKPCYGKIVKAISPAQEVIFDNNAIAYPAPLTRLERGSYYIQAVWDRNMGGRNIGTSPGNMYSKAIKIDFTDDTTQVTNLVCDQLVPQPVFENTTFVKEFRAPSKLLSKFHHKDITIDAAVILPAQYFLEPARKFPVVFNIAGYGADYHHYSKENGDTVPSIPIDTTPCIKVYLDGNCPLGHCVYANSENTGPWADALAKDFIPLLQKKYRCNGALLMKGHSSGGWACLWLQIHYPKLFAGCNASAPDPVDFRSFVKCNKYEGKPLTNTNVFENVAYRGEQDHSFDAVFGPRGANGEIMCLYDYTTGKMNPEVLEHWKQYDISLYLRKNWGQLKKDLGDKIRISVGNEDTYFLNLPVHLLEDEMKNINATITFAYYPGNHATVSTAAYRHDQDKWLEDKYHEWLNKHP